MPEETTGHGGVPPEGLFFLDAVADPVKQQLGTSVLLADFLRSAGNLTIDNGECWSSRRCLSSTRTTYTCH